MLSQPPLLLVLNQGVQLAAHQGASLRQLFNFALQRIAPRLINAGNQRLIFGDGRMLRGTAERTRGTGLQASTLGLKTGNARFHFAQGFHIAQLLILLFISLTALSQYRFQFSCSCLVACPAALSCIRRWPRG